MQAGKAEKQPPTHPTGDTADADSTAVCAQRCPHQYKRCGADAKMVWLTRIDYYY
jgi:hypothetical protein